MAELTSWQSDLFEAVCKQLDNEDKYHLNWVADLRDIDKAEYSKDFMIEYFRCVFGEDQVAVFENKKTGDVYRDLELREYPRVVVFDYFFCAKYKLNYSVPRCLKDGDFFDTRWHGRKYWLGRGRIIVVIFSNFLPNVNKYSRERLMLTKLD